MPEVALIEMKLFRVNSCCQKLSGPINPLKELMASDVFATKTVALKEYMTATAPLKK